MSGLEIVGVVLGVVPFVIKAYDRSNAVVRELLNLSKQNFIRELTSIQRIFSTQKVIFRAQASHIRNAIERDASKAVRYHSSSLSSEAGRPDALADSYEENEKLELLNDLFENCQKILRELLQELVSTTIVLEKFKTGQSKTHQVPGHDFKKRLKLSWQQSGIDQRIGKLRQLNGDFSTLGSEIIRMLSERELSLNPVPEQAQALEYTPKIYTYQHIQHASSRLYKTFSEKWQCGSHEKHTIHLCSAYGLEGCVATGSTSFMIVITSNDDSTEHLHNLKFEVKHCQCEATGKLEDSLETSSTPIATRMEISLGGRVVNDFLSLLRKASEGWIPDHVPNDAAKLKRRPRFNYLHSNIPLAGLALNRTFTKDDDVRDTPGLTPDPQSDLQCVSDHCIYFGERRKTCLGRTCLGYIVDECTERFYFQPLEQDIDGHPVSLADLIRKISEDSFIPALPRSLVMNLAHSIADTVLQLYSSPWLPERWDSNHINFLGIQALDAIEELLKPYSLYVTLKFGDESKGKQAMGINQKPLGVHTVDASQPHVLDWGVRNERLFCLGVVLLELGYAKPWQVLRSSVIRELHTSQKSDYLVAEVLARKLVHHMGMDYVRIIRKCLACDFGLGETDLGDEELGKKFVEDVIEVLRAVERGLTI